MSMKKVSKGAKGGKGKGKDKEPEEESYAHVLAMNWQWSTDTDRIFIDQFGLDDEVNKRIFFDRAPLEGDDLEDYPDPLDPPPWIDVGEGRPKAINMTIAGPMLKRKMERKVKPREVSSEVKEEVKEVQETEQGKDGPLWIPANIYDPTRHKDWDFKEEIPPYILAMHADPSNPTKITGKIKKVNFRVIKNERILDRIAPLSKVFPSKKVVTIKQKEDERGGKKGGGGHHGKKGGHQHGQHHGHHNHGHHGHLGGHHSPRGKSHHEQGGVSQQAGSIERSGSKEATPIGSLTPGSLVGEAPPKGVEEHQEEVKAGGKEDANLVDGASTEGDAQGSRKQNRRQRGSEVTPGTVSSGGARVTRQSENTDKLDGDAEGAANLLSWWSHLKPNENDCYKVQNVFVNLKKLVEDEHKDGGQQIHKYGKQLSAEKDQPKGANKPQIKQVASIFESADATAEQLISSKVERMAHVADEDIVRYARTKDFRALHRDILPVWTQRELEVVVGYDDGKEGDLVKISREFANHASFQQYRGMHGMLTRPDTELQCWYVVFSDGVGKGDVKVKSKEGVARRKVAPAKTLEALRSKLTKAPPAGAAGGGDAAGPDKPAPEEENGRGGGDAGVAERMFCTGHAGKFWLAFAEPEKHIANDGFSRTRSGVMNSQELDDVPDIEEMAAQISVELEAAARKMPRSAVLEKRLRSIKERCSDELMPPTPREPEEQAPGSGKNIRGGGGGKNVAAKAKPVADPAKIKGSMSVFGDSLLDFDEEDEDE